MVRPNVLFICADDLSHTGRLLNLLIDNFDLPNLRRLQSSGTDFDRAYCVVPVCEPARTAMMTGLSPAETKSMDLSVGWGTIVHPRHLWTYRLREAGYWMGTVGKVFHGYVSQPAWIYRELYDSQPFDFGAWNPTGTATEHGGMYGRGWDDEVEWYDAKVANWVINHLNTYQGDRPWYQEAGFFRPHVAFEAPNRFFDMIPIERVKLPTSWQGGFDTMPFVNEFVVSGELGYASNDPATWTADQMLYVRQTIRNYAAGALWMDHNLGRILDALAASRFKDNTIVTFYSDHGYHLSDHGKWHKFTLYEQAALAPLIVRVPGQTPRKVTSPVSHIDLGATILDLCGIAIPAGHRGVSLKPWTQGQTPADRAIPTFWYGSVSAAKGNKRVTVYQDGTAEMFNIDTDPWARKNIAATDSTFTGLREDVLKLAADWGMLLVEEAVDTSRPSSLQSILGTKATDTRFSTSFVALGDLHPKGRSPGWQKMYSNQTSANPDVKMPPHIEDFQLMGTKAGKMNLSGNDLPNRVNMAGVFWKELVIDFGAGDDENVTPEKTRIIAYGRAGNDILRAGTWGGSKLYGGSGNDTLYGDDGADLLDGGEGNDSIRGGDGNDTLIAGPGLDTLDGGNGADRLMLDAGANDARGGADADTFVVSRTGEVQTIRDLTSTDVLDLTDWAPIQPVSVVQSGADAIVTAGLEKIVCKAATVATVKAVIRGASYV